MDLEIWLLKQASIIYGTVFGGFVHFYVNTQPQNFMYFFLLLALHKACSLNMFERP
jgi:F0F1-type ATP synthase assembly protein I